MNFKKLSMSKKILLLLAIVVTYECVYIICHLPGIFAMRDGEVESSAFIRAYEDRRDDNKKLPKLRFTAGSVHLSRAQLLPFIVAEDSRFYEHSGVDPQAFYDAMVYNWNAGKMALGASTISQQTVKNLFLSPSRNPLRKWHELVLTLTMEAIVDKKDILSVYLGIAEFGEGLYGLHAAASYYFRKSAISSLTRDELTALAASLPSPKKSNPNTRSRFHQKRVDRIAATLRRYYAPRVAAEQPSSPPKDPDVDELESTDDQDYEPETPDNLADKTLNTESELQNTDIAAPEEYNDDFDSVDYDSEVEGDSSSSPTNSQFEAPAATGSELESSEPNP